MAIHAFAKIKNKFSSLLHTAQVSTAQVSNVKRLEPQKFRVGKSSNKFFCENVGVKCNFSS